MKLASAAEAVISRDVYGTSKLVPSRAARREENVITILFVGAPSPQRGENGQGGYRQYLRI